MGADVYMFKTGTAEVWEGVMHRDRETSLSALTIDELYPQYRLK
jgi:hypothetical protein